MAGTLTPPVAGSPEDTGLEAIFVLQGTGTRNDGRRVRALAWIDPATGLAVAVLPVEQGFLAQNTDHVTTHDQAGNDVGGIAPVPSGGAPTATNTNPIGVLPNPAGGAPGEGMAAYLSALLGLQQQGAGFVGIAAPAAGSQTGVTKWHAKNVTGTVQVVKGSAGLIYGYAIINTSGATAFVQIFDAATAGAVTLGTTDPDLQAIVATGSTANLMYPVTGVNMANGIVVASATAVNGGTGSAAGVYVLILYR